MQSIYMKGTKGREKRKSTLNLTCLGPMSDSTFPLDFRKGSVDTNVSIPTEANLLPENHHLS